MERTGMTPRPRLAPCDGTVGAARVAGPGSPGGDASERAGRNQRPA